MPDVTRILARFDREQLASMARTIFTFREPTGWARTLAQKTSCSATRTAGKDLSYSPALGNLCREPREVVKNRRPAASGTGNGGKNADIPKVGIDLSTRIDSGAD